MPYQHCPTCRLTVHLTDTPAGGGPCPRCGEPLADQPRRFAGATPTGLDPEAVRRLLAERGGRFARAAASRTRRFAPGRPSRAA